MDREIRGRMRQVLVHMNKSGITSVLDRATGELLGVFSVPEVQTWISGITEDGKLVGRVEPQLGKTTTVCPTAAGAKSWNSMAYSPRTGYLYVPVNELCEDITPNNAAPQEGQNYMNGEFPLKLAPGRTTYSHVDAWDPVTGKRAWSMPYKYVLLASMLATAGDLVFTGNPEGEFFALDAKSGNEAVELSNRRRPSRSIGFVCGERTAIHRHFDWMACLGGRRRGSEFVSGSGLAAGLDAGGICAAGGIAMKFLVMHVSPWRCSAPRRMRSSAASRCLRRPALRVTATE